VARPTFSLLPLSSSGAKREEGEKRKRKPFPLQNQEGRGEAKLLPLQKDDPVLPFNAF